MGKHLLRSGALALAAATALVGAGPSVGAQRTPPPIPVIRVNPPIHNLMLGNIIAQGAQRRAMMKKAAQRRGRGTTTATGGANVPTRYPAPTTGGTSRPATSGTTTFVPVAESIAPARLAAELSDTDQQRRELEKLFAEFLTFHGKILKDKGLKPYDVARATSYFILVNYDVYSGRRGATPRQAEALRESVREEMLADDGFRRMSDRDKQLKYETLIVLGQYVGNSYQGGERDGNARVVAHSREMAKKNLEVFFGVPVEKIRFTDEGIEID